MLTSIPFIVSAGTVHDPVDTNQTHEDEKYDIGNETNFAYCQDSYPDNDYMNIQENNTGTGGGGEGFLYVDSFTDTRPDWTFAYTDDPYYLHDIDYDEDYIYTKTADVTAGDWGFENTSYSGMHTVFINVYASCDRGYNDGYDLYVNNGSGFYLADTAVITAQDPNFEWNNVSLGSLTANQVNDLQFYFEYYGSAPNDYCYIDYVCLNYTASPNANYELDFEYGWTSADYDETTETLCFEIDSHTGNDDLWVSYWTGSTWSHLGTITATGWTNFTATGLTSNTYSIRLNSTANTSDSTQDDWDIDVIKLYCHTDTEEWYGSYSRRKLITVSPNIEGYQTNLTIYKAPGHTYNLNNHCNNNFSDIRFVRMDNITLIPYWIENYTSGSSCKVWVNNSYNDTQFWIYYDLPSTGDASDGDATFLFFDNFTSGSLDTTKWQLDGATTGFSEGWITVTANTAPSSWARAGIVTKTDWYDNYLNLGKWLTFEGYGGYNNGNAEFFIATSSTPHDESYSTWLTWQWQSGDWDIRSKYTASAYHLYDTNELTELEHLRHDVYGTNGDCTNSWVGNTMYDGDYDDLYSQTDFHFGLGTDGNGESSKWDYCFIRYYLSSPPVYSFGEEDSGDLWENSNPEITADSENPPNSQTNVYLSLSNFYNHFNITVSDDDNANQSINVTWRAKISGVWTDIGYNESDECNQTFYCSNVDWINSYSTTYYWSVNISDNHTVKGWKNQTFSFTTRSNPISWHHSDFGGNVTVAGDINDPPVVENPNPPNSATDISLSTTQLSVWINDSEGDSFNWSIETSPDIGSNSANGASNGSKTCSISSLQPHTTYSWYVNTTDWEGSEVWNNKTYSFTTLNNNPVISNENPVNQSITVSSVPTISIQANDSDADSMTVTWYEGNYTNIVELYNLYDNYTAYDGMGIDDDYIYSGYATPQKYWKNNGTHVLTAPQNMLENYTPTMTHKGDPTVHDGVLYCTYGIATGTRDMEFVAVYTSNLSYKANYTFPRNDLYDYEASSMCFHEIDGTMYAWLCVSTGDDDKSMLRLPENLSWTAETEQIYDLDDSYDYNINGVTFVGNYLFTSYHGVGDGIVKWRWNGNGFDYIMTYTAGTAEPYLNQGLEYYEPDDEFWGMHSEGGGGDDYAVCCRLTGWNQVQQNVSVSNGTYQYELNVSAKHTYYWRVTLNDSYNGWDNETYHFTIADTTIDIDIAPHTWHAGDHLCGTDIQNNFTFYQNGTATIRVDIGFNNTNYTFVNYTTWLSDGNNQYCANFTIDSWSSENMIEPKSGDTPVTILKNSLSGSNSFEFGVRIWMPKGVTTPGILEDYKIMFVATEI